MNWKYLILDEGWQPNATVPGKVYDGYFDYFDELIDYADSKGVGFIVWVKYVDLDTAKEREILREWAKLGIKGIKADFFDDERPTVIADMQEIYRICAEEHLLVNLHGANKPTGERSLYPNVINREAVNGQEFGAVSTSNMTVWPYTRGVLGPSDITPTLYPTASTTVGHQLAINIVTESGMPCMASDSEVYREAAVKSYLRALPARWDDLRFLCGEPFRSAVLARRSGNEWWVGGLANGSADAAFSLDYLDEGKDYLAVLYEDGDGQNEVRITESTVRRGDSMSLSMKQNGGFVLRLIPKDDVKEVETITPSGTLYTVNAGETLRISATVSPANAVHADLVYSVSDPSVASVSEGGVVTALHPGVTEIVIRNEKSGVWASAELRIVRPLGMQKSEDWILYNGNSSAPAKFFGDAPNRAELTVLTGDVWNDPQSLLRDAPEGDFTVTVKLTGGLTKDFQSAGLSAYAGYGRMVLMERRSHTGLGGNVFCLSTHDGKGYTEYRVPEKDPAADAYLKLEKKGNVFTGYYSYDGKTFTRLPQTINAAYVGGAEDLKVGIVTRSGAYQAQMQVTFESFTLNGEVKPFSVNVTEKELCKLYPAKLSVPVGYSPAGQTPALPATVRGYLSDGHFAEIPVEWNTAGLDFSRNGILNVTGKIKTGSPYAGSGLLPHLQILVGEVSPYDLDGDSILTVQDVTLLLRYLAAPQSVTLVRTGDINGDGKVSAKDISRLLHLL